MPDIGCEEFELDVRLEKPKPRNSRKLSAPGRGIENKNFVPTSLNLATTTINTTTSTLEPTSSLAPPPITDLLSPLDGSEVTTFNQKHQSNSADTLVTPLDDFVTITPLNIKSPANDFRSDDCNELIMRELDLLESKENAKRELVSQSSVDVLPLNREEPLENGVETINQYYGEVWFGSCIC